MTDGALGGLRAESYLRSSKAFVGVRLVRIGWRALQLRHRVVRRRETITVRPEYLLSISAVCFSTACSRVADKPRELIASGASRPNAASQATLADSVASLGAECDSVRLATLPVPLWTQAGFDTSGATWYDKQRVMDLTDDGTPDTLRLRAFGARADSSNVLLSIHSGGQTIWRIGWDTPYSLVDGPELGASEVHAYVTGQLDSMLAKADLAPLDTTGVEWQDLKQPVARELARRGARGVSFCYGYESCETIVWSRCERRFITVAACC
jgi:hypothetical protein